MAQNACCTYDCTFSEQYFTKDTLEDWFKKECKTWCFQLEEGEGGFRHFQTRFSLKTKKRLNELLGKLPQHHGKASPTSKENMNNNFYVMKEDTRVDGPWTEKDCIMNIPRQVRDIILKPWQQTMKDMLHVWDTRNINYIYDINGNIGKSTFITFCGVYKLGKRIPLCNDYKDILRMVYDMPKLGAYFIDMPRAIKKEKLYQFWSAIETVKDGYCYDDRYEFKDIYFDCPNIFVFGNTLPDKTLLTADRWVFWHVVDERLERYEPLDTFRVEV